MKDCHVFAAVFALLLVVAIAPGVHAQCVTGTVTAEYQTSGPYAGLYKYTAVLTWDTEQGLSNITIDCKWDECPEQVCSQTFLFDTPAGSSDGEGGCTVDYEGEFNCSGNPSIGVDWPIVKWDAVGDCEPGSTGTATLCFYTNLGPEPDCGAPVILVKNGLNVCEGMVEGDCPAAPCLVPTEDVSWGAVKAKFR